MAKGTFDLLGGGGGDVQTLLRELNDWLYTSPLKQETTTLIVLIKK